MSTSVDEFLKSFDALSKSDQHEAVAALLRRALRDAPREIPDDAFIALADELFLELDSREAADGQP